MLKISRDSQYINCLRKYKIYIDNTLLDTINNGEIKEINLSNGKHSIFFKLGFFKSNTLSFTVKDNQFLHFKLNSSLNLLKLCTVLICIIFFKYSWLFKFTGLIILIYLVYNLFVKNNYLSITEQQI